MSHFLLVLSSPSGGGKSTIARKLIQGRDDVAYSVSATTRAPRQGETDGRDYYFLTEEEFDRRISQDGFLEWAEYSGHRYGTLRSEIERILSSGNHAVLDIEVEGARQLRQRFDDAVTVFLLPPSGSELAARLRDRETESEAQVARRLEHAQEEILAAGDYDYVVVNEDLIHAVEQVASIVEAESLKTGRQDQLAERLENLKRGVAQAGSPAK